MGLLRRAALIGVGLLIGLFITIELAGDTGAMANLRLSNISLGSNQFALKTVAYGVDGTVAADSTDVVTALGEVQDEPTQYTVLDRLKAIASAVTAQVSSAISEGDPLTTPDLTGVAARRKDTAGFEAGVADGDAAALTLGVGARLRVEACIDSDFDGDCDALATETVTAVVDLDNDETETEIDDTAGCIAGLFANNRDTTPVFIKVFLDDADNVTVGSTAPGLVFGVPSNGTDSVGGNLLPSGVCIPYTNGLSIATVTDEADAASTGPGANEVVLTVLIKT